MNFLRHSLKANIIAIVSILTTVVYIITIYSPCPQGRFIYSKDELSKWCEAPNQHGKITKHGPWVATYESGTMKSRGEYLYDVMDGHWVYWYENGHKKEEGNLKQGKRYGRWSKWNSKGELVSEQKY